MKASRLQQHITEIMAQGGDFEIAVLDPDSGDHLELMPLPQSTGEFNDEEGVLYLSLKPNNPAPFIAAAAGIYDTTTDTLESTDFPGQPRGRGDTITTGKPMTNTERQPNEYCDECGAIVPPDARRVTGAWHAKSCSAHEPLTDAERYLTYEKGIWRVEFNKSHGQTPRVHYVEATEAEDEADVRRWQLKHAPHDVHIVSIRRATIDDAPELERLS